MNEGWGWRNYEGYVVLKHQLERLWKKMDVADLREPLACHWIHKYWLVLYKIHLEWDSNTEDTVGISKFIRRYRMKTSLGFDWQTLSHIKLLCI